MHRIALRCTVDGRRITAVPGFRADPERRPLRRDRRRELWVLFEKRPQPLAASSFSAGTPLIAASSTCTVCAIGNSAPRR